MSMIKNMTKGLRTMALAVAVLACAACACFVVLATPQTALAVTEDTYILTWPDGSVVETTDAAEAERLQSEWKLLYSGKTDASGNIVLEGWAEEGEILIKETKAPTGYIFEKADTTANLADGTVTIVNQRALPPTGDASGLGMWVAVGMAAAAVAAAALLRRKVLTK